MSSERVTIAFPGGHALPGGHQRKERAAAAGSHCIPELVGRVLVVDDNARARQSMADVLSAAGHDVRAAASAVEALRVVEQGPWDVIITDLQMPGMDGLALLHATERSESQIVMVTAFASVTSAVEAADGRSTISRSRLM
jgi:CheY-like chemotaxis protein